MFAGRTNWNLTLNRLSEALSRHRAAGKALLDLTASNPTECGFEYASCAILEALSNPAALKYSPDAQRLADCAGGRGRLITRRAALRCRLTTSF